MCRFMNGTAEGNGIHSEAEAAALVQNVKFSGEILSSKTASKCHHTIYAFKVALPLQIGIHLEAGETAVHLSKLRLFTVLEVNQPA